MRLSERDKRNVYLRRWAEPIEDKYGDKTRQWGPPVLVRAVVQPAKSLLDMQIYGERVKRMKRLYYDGDIKILEGDGLCIDVAGDQEPDYMVLSAMAWDHVEVDAERQKEQPSRPV